MSRGQLGQQGAEAVDIGVVETEDHLTEEGHFVGELMEGLLDGLQIAVGVEMILVDRGDQDGGSDLGGRAGCGRDLHRHGDQHR